MHASPPCVRRLVATGVPCNVAVERVIGGVFGWEMRDLGVSFLGVGVVEGLAVLVRTESV